MSNLFSSFLTKLLQRVLAPESQPWPGFAHPPAGMTGIPAGRFF